MDFVLLRERLIDAGGGVGCKLELLQHRLRAVFTLKSNFSASREEFFTTRLLFRAKLTAPSRINNGACSSRSASLWH